MTKQTHFFLPLKKKEIDSLIQFNLFTKPPWLKDTYTQFKGHEIDKQSISYKYHLEKMRSEQNEATSFLNQFEIKGIIFSNDDHSLVILEDKTTNKKLYLKKSDKILHWTIQSIHKTFVSFHYKQNAKLIKVLHVKKK